MSDHPLISLRPSSIHSGIPLLQAMPVLMNLKACKLAMNTITFIFFKFPIIGNSASKKEVPLAFMASHC